MQNVQTEYYRAIKRVICKHTVWTDVINIMLSGERQSRNVHPDDSIHIKHKTEGPIHAAGREGDGDPGVRCW